MQTQKLYYEDPEKKSFLAKVTGCEAAKGGYLVTLDATAFYPEGGGQPCDLGRLGDAFFLNRILRGQHILFVNQTGKAFRAAAAGRVSFLRGAHGRNRAGRLVLILEQIHTVFCSFTQMPQENFRCGPYSLHAGHTLL